MINEIKWVDHLAELRKRLIYSVLFLIIVTIPLFYYSNGLFHYIAQPLLVHLPNQSKMIATSISSPVFVPLQLALITGLMITMPIFLYHLWSFIAPALRHSEKKIIWPTLIISIILFYLGITFSYFIVVPFLIHFFLTISTSDILFMPDIKTYLSFILKLLFSFGLCFQIPIVIFLLIQYKLFTYIQIKTLRRYVILISFVVAMFIGPPDFFSQIALAIPIWLLYELGLVASLIFKNTNEYANEPQKNSSIN
ncbi:MAG: twin-arginine translocase subunit TatC [Gammaproteobacteria bacterium]